MSGLLTFSANQVFAQANHILHTHDAFPVLQKIVDHQAPMQTTPDFHLYLHRHFKDAQGTTLPYRVLFPENYDRQKKYPLVLFLHGAGEVGTDNEKQLIHGGDFFLKYRHDFPAIVIVPQCPSNYWWPSVKVDYDTAPLGLNFDYRRPLTPPLAAAIALVQYFIQNEAVDGSRVYIGGLSMGGMGTYEAISHEPNLFAAAVAICGGADLARFRSNPKLPFWIFAGDQDKTVDVNNSRKIVALLKSENKPVKYTEYPGVGHNSWDNAFAEPSLMSWLFSQRQ